MFANMMRRTRIKNTQLNSNECCTSCCRPFQFVLSIMKHWIFLLIHGKGNITTVVFCSLTRWWNNILAHIVSCNSICAAFKWEEVNEFNESATEPDRKQHVQVGGRNLSHNYKSILYFCISCDRAVSSCAPFGLHLEFGDDCCSDLYNHIIT